MLFWFACTAILFLSARIFSGVLEVFEFSRIAWKGNVFG